MFESITKFDFSVLDFIANNIRCAILDPVFALFSHFADAGIGWIIISLILIIFKKTRKWGIIALISMTVGLLIGEVFMKNIFCRMRPYDAYMIYHNSPIPFVLNVGTESSFSFPSGHTCCSFASATAFFIGNKKWGIIALIGAFLIGFSRLYNYVHYPSDVFAGMILGIFSAIIVYSVYKILINRREKYNGKIASK